MSSYSNRDVYRSLDVSCLRPHLLGACSDACRPSEYKECEACGGRDRCRGEAVAELEAQNAFNAARIMPTELACIDLLRMV